MVEINKADGIIKSSENLTAFKSLESLALVLKK